MKVLVAAASRHGSTQMIADCIHEELEYAGCQASLADAEGVTSLAEYDAVVLGSAVYEGHWLKAARKLVDRLEADLRARPVWLFSSGPVGDGPAASAPPVDAGEIATRLHAREHRIFGGRLERERLGLGERLRVRGVAPEGDDDRSWLEIGRWARSIATALRAEPAPRARPVP